MIHRARDEGVPKGWFVGPWDSDLPVPVGYANEGVNERHYHARMYEVYLVAQGRCKAVVEGQEVALAAGELLVVEPGEVHTFVDSTEDYLHFVVQIPFVEGDKHLVD